MCASEYSFLNTYLTRSTTGPPIHGNDGGDDDTCDGGQIS